MLTTEVRQKCLAKIAMVRRAGAYLPYDGRKMLYQSFVLPHLDYCSIIWHTCGATLTNRIERVQNYALRMIFQKPPRTSSAELQTKLNMTTLEHRRRNNMICQVHRCLLNQAPSYPSSKFGTNSSFGCISICESSKIRLKRPVLEFYRSSFEFHGAKLYNDLPESI